MNRMPISPSFLSDPGPSPNLGPFSFPQTLEWQIQDARLLLPIPQYNAQIGELSVTITIDQYLISPSGEFIENKFYDHLIGLVSQENMTWNVTWTRGVEMIEPGLIKEAPIQLTFTKVAENVVN